MAQRTGDAPGGVVSIPRFQPGPNALFQIGNDLVGDRTIGRLSPIVVETSSGLLGPWVPVQSASLTNGEFYFKDSQYTHNRNQFYRLSFP